MPTRTGRSNLEACKSYRSSVERDIARPQVSSSVDGLAAALGVVGLWSARYTRRRDAIVGSFGGPPIADGDLIKRLGARWRARDAACPGTPAWGDSLADAARMSYDNMGRMGRLDAASPEAPHSFGPSLRALWLAAEARGGDRAACVAAVAAWARAASPAWERTKLAPKARLETRLVWRDMEDPDEPWAAMLEGETWRIRLNEFPDEPAYGLWSGARHLGDFHDWPTVWSRGGVAAPAPRPATKADVPGPAVAIGAPRRLVERFDAGDCAAVWRELIALGPDARKAPYAEPALAIAYETMRRARRNIELLVPRLRAMGYVFGGPPEPPPGEKTIHVAGPGGGGAIGFSDLMRRVDDAKRAPDAARSHLHSLLGMIGDLAQRQASKPGKSNGRRDVFRPAAPTDARRLARLERRGLPLPLSLRAWAEVVGLVDLTGHGAGLAWLRGPGFAGVLADPLAIVASADRIEEQTGDWDAAEDPPLPLFVGLDAESKAAASADDIDPDGGYTISAPDAAADAVLRGCPGELGFVAYLRRAFRNGGFAGWGDAPRRPDAVIARLVEGFAPL